MSRPPTLRLRPWVRRLWSLKDDAPAGISTVAPDGCPELVVHLGALPDRTGPAVIAGPTPAAFLVTAIDRPVTLVPRGPVRVLGASFEPGGLGPWIPVPAGGLGGGVPLPDVLGQERTARLRERLTQTRGTAARLDVLEAALIAWQRSNVVPGPEVAVRRLLACTREAPPAAVLAGQVGLSLRTLQRLAHDRFGIGVRQLGRVFRFQRAARALTLLPPRSLTALAVEAGYYDYPHMARDFHEFAGVTPARFLAEPSPFGAAFLRDGAGAP